MSLITIDPYESAYKAQRMIDPSFSYTHKPVKRSHVNAIDNLLKEIGHRQAIETESDWQALECVIKFYVNQWPDDFKQFADSIPDIRKTRKAGGYSDSKEIKYVGALPYRLERLIKTCFPYQEFNKDFVYRLISKVRLFKIGGEGN